MQPRHREELISIWDARADREPGRELEHPAKQVHTDLLWREIHRSVGGRDGLSILDAGAGTGRFSLPLARDGHRVTYLDISEKMLEIARNNSRERGIGSLQFVSGRIDDLSRFEEGSFDLILCLDSPLSYCYDCYEGALAELVRVARSRIILCVMNRLGVISEAGVEFDLEHFGRLKTVLDVYRTGTLVVTQEMRELQLGLMPSWHAFTPGEIKVLLEENGCEIERISAPGTLARFVESERLKNSMKDRAAYESFLDFEEEYDSDESVLGVGAVGAGGLLVTVRKVRVAQCFAPDSGEGRPGW